MSSPTDRRPTESPFDQQDVFAAATGADAYGSGGDWRERLRRSKLGTLAVLGLTALLVVGGSWFVSRDREVVNTGDESWNAVSDVEMDVEATGPAPKVGERPADFTATTLDGETVALSDLQGRPVWLLVGATWCSACRAEQPDVQAAKDRYGDDLVILSVYLGEDRPTVADYSRRLDVTYTEVPDPSKEISASYRVMGVPSHFFIDREGVLRSTTIGALGPNDIDEQVRTIL